MPDFSSSEKTGAVSPLPENPFAHLPHVFLLKPLLIMGKAMHYYGLRSENEAHFLVPKPEFERLWAAIPEGHFTTVQNEKGVRVGNYNFYVKLFGFSYYDLEIEAMEERDYFVVHFEFLLFLNTVTLIHDPENQQARQDVLLLLERLGVWVSAPNMLPEMETASPNVASLDGTFEEVKQITITRLSPEVQMVLVQHGCTLDEYAHEHIRVTFPEKTQRQLLLPPTAIERYRVVFVDGLELRHEIDRTREMSLLSVVSYGEVPKHLTEHE
jgi:hypothetical protein